MAKPAKPAPTITTDLYGKSSAMIDLLNSEGFVRLPQAQIYGEFTGNHTSAVLLGYQHRPLSYLYLPH